MQLHTSCGKCLQMHVLYKMSLLTMSVFRASVTRSPVSDASSPFSCRPWGVHLLSAAFNICSRLGLLFADWSLTPSSVVAAEASSSSSVFSEALSSICGSGYSPGSGRCSQEAPVCSFSSNMTPPAASNEVNFDSCSGDPTGDQVVAQPYPAHIHLISCCKRLFTLNSSSSWVTLTKCKVDN